ncbi:MAG: hypothetical protein LAN64_14355 [Acidobacteriia bacterium]|nr:hypothetical protein [Terriglobia bacterium]
MVDELSNCELTNLFREVQGMRKNSILQYSSIRKFDNVLVVSAEFSTLRLAESWRDSEWVRRAQPHRYTRGTYLSKAGGMGLHHFLAAACGRAALD